MDAAPIADDLGDKYFCAFMNSKELRTRTVWRGFGIHHPLSDDRFSTLGITLVQAIGIDERSNRKQHSHNTGVERRLAQPYGLAEGKEEKAH